MRSKNRKNVLLALGWFDHRLIQGIASYAVSHNWHISSGSIIQEMVVPWGWRGDGVLAWLTGNDELAEFVVSLKKPTVDFSLRRAHLPFAHVVLDHQAAAAMAAEHFLSRGFKNFMFYSSALNWTFQERGKGFESALKSVGHRCTWLKWREAQNNKSNREQWSNRRAWLLKALKSAPKPLAVLTASGTLTLEVLEVCQGYGLAVPNDVAVIGIEDDFLLPQSNLLSVTTIDPNLEEQGYQGAALLDRMIDGEPVPRGAVRVKPSRIITRQSTDITAVTHAGVAKALEFIQANFEKRIDVNAVARNAGMSRRGLHKAFVESLGRTPGAHIRTVRIEFAQKLLADTDSKVESIAMQSGYPSLNSFFVAFKQSSKITPAEFRRRAQRAR